MINNYDIVIIGGGPAGVSCGIYALRAGLKALVLDNNSSALEKADVIENYYGIEKVSGKELKKQGLKQIQNLGGEVVFEEVVGIIKNYEKNSFNVSTKNSEYVSKCVVLCMGAGKKKSVEVLENKVYENLSYCAVCDGFFYRGKSVAVIGDGAFAIHEYEYLKKIAGHVYLLTNGKQISVRNSSNIDIIQEEIDYCVGENRILEIVLKNKQKLKVDGVFVAQGTLSSFEIAKQMGILTKDNSILVDENFMTNIQGVFAAGDIVGGLLQVAKAVSDGAIAGLSVVKHIRNTN